jgi:hypothetical protein
MLTFVFDVIEACFREAPDGSWGWGRNVRLRRDLAAIICDNRKGDLVDLSPHRMHLPPEIKIPGNY